MASHRVIMDGLSFDDVLVVPAFSAVRPRDVCPAGAFSRRITLPLPIVSAAMDTVTEAPLAVTVARAGGIGVLHKNMSVEAQAAQVRVVKASAIVQEAATSEGGEEATDYGFTPCTDSAGRLRVAAAIGVTEDSMIRATAVVEAGADALVIDAAHGHATPVADMVRRTRAAFPSVDVVAGNVATGAGVSFLTEAGADGVKVGMGPGSICTTRIVCGIGVPQMTCIFESAAAAEAAAAVAGTPMPVPIIADGGLRYSGDIVKALAGGATSVMLGGMLAGTAECPGEVITAENGTVYKAYCGMGSLPCMQKGSRDRYLQDFEDDVTKLVPEGVEARVPFKGPASRVLYQIAGGLRAGMGYCGATSLGELRRATFTRITNAGVRESHPHDVTITRSAPNYTSSK